MTPTEKAIQELETAIKQNEFILNSIDNVIKTDQEGGDHIVRRGMIVLLAAQKINFVRGTSNLLSQLIQLKSKLPKPEPSEIGEGGTGVAALPPQEETTPSE